VLLLRIIQQIASTPFIRRNLIKEFPDAEGISDLMLKFSDLKKSDIRNKIETMKEDGKKISASLDEWTSRSNRRFLNIILSRQQKLSISIWV
jgi:hypothetical protein